MKKNGARPARKYLFQVVVTYDSKEPGPYKYTVDVPAVPGCFSEGRSREEALRNIKEAIALMVPSRPARGKRKSTEFVEVAC